VTDHHEDTRSVQLHPDTHRRLQAVARPTETLTATILRALDALAREQALPPAVTEQMSAATYSSVGDAPDTADGDANTTPSSFRVRESAHERLWATRTDADDSLSDVIDRALDALERESDLCPAVHKAVGDTEASDGGEA
jgi:hypothetical protein